MNKNIKKLGIIILILAVGFFIYNYFSSPDDTNLQTGISNTGGLSSSVPPAGSTVSVAPTVNEFSTLLANIKNINIDTTILQDPSYKALRDYPVVLGTDVMGRPNPFAPIGSDSGIPVSTGVSIQTMPAGKITSNSAEIGASVTMTPGSMPVSVMIQYGVGDSFDKSTNPTSLISSNSVVLNIEGLIPNTLYSVRAIAVQGSNTVMGEALSFSTTQ